MTRFHFSSLSTRLMLLVFLPILLALGLILYTASEQRDQVQEDLQENALQTLKLVSFYYEREIQEARVRLAFMAELPELQTGDSGSCGRFLSKLKLNPIYHDFGVAADDGTVRCSILPGGAHRSVADQAYFKRALETRAFSIGEYQIDPATGKSFLYFGYPQFDSQGKTKSVLFSVLNMAGFEQISSNTRLSHDAVILLADRNGTIISRYPHPEKWVGKSPSNIPILQTILEDGKGTAKVRDVDGTLRIYAFSTLLGTPNPADMYVGIGLSMANELSETNKILSRNIATITVVGALFLAMMWVCADRFILRPIQALVSATKMLGITDLSSCAGIPQGRWELGELAGTIDKLAKSLIELRHRNDLVLRSAGEGICGVDVQGNITFINPAGAKMLGYEADELIGRAADGVLHSLKRSGIPNLKEESPINRAFKHKFSHQMLDEVFLRKDGTSFPVEYVTTLIQEKNETIGAVIVFKDITVHKVQAASMEYEAMHDVLTGLPNRTLFYDRLQQALLARRRDSKPLGLLILNLHSFKEVNHTHGPHKGDLLLRHVSVRIREALRDSDTVACLEEEEFAILLTGADIGGAILVARNILKVLTSPLTLGDAVIDVKVSIGIAICPDHGDDPDQLIKRAEMAGEAANHSENGYAVYRSEQEQHRPRHLVFGRVTLMEELRYAIENNQLLLAYQPKIDLRSFRVAGVEALVRWQHPHLGMLPPVQFISLAEQTDLIRPLTRWVLNKALTQCRAWIEEGWEVGVAVNLSVRNLQDPQLPDQIADLLQANDVEPILLEAEITESVLMTDPGRSMGVLMRLRKMGTSLSIDDFGTGYSSLGYLNKLPLNAIKIDKSFIMGMTSTSDDVTIVRSTIDLGHNLGLKVVAEGVENKEAWDCLASLGCDVVQGYYISRPVYAEELTNWMKNDAVSKGWTPSRSKADLSQH